MLTHPLLPKLRQLKLSGMLNTLETRAAQATERQLAPTEFLALLLDDELERRSQQRLDRRLAQSGCHNQKTLVHFDFAAAPGVNRSLIQELASQRQITRTLQLQVDDVSDRLQALEDYLARPWYRRRRSRRTGSAE